MLCCPESGETKDSDESLRCEFVECDREPPGDRGRGGGRRGGKRSLMFAQCHACVRQMTNNLRGAVGVEARVTTHAQRKCATSAPALPKRPLSHL